MFVSRCICREITILNGGLFQFVSSYDCLLYLSTYCLRWGLICESLLLFIGTSRQYGSHITTQPETSPYVGSICIAIVRCESSLAGLSSLADQAKSCNVVAGPITGLANTKSNQPSEFTQGRGKRFVIGNYLMEIWNEMNTLVQSPQEFLSQDYTRRSTHLILMYLDHKDCHPRTQLHSTT